MAHFLLFSFSFPFYFFVYTAGPGMGTPAEAFCAPVVPGFIMLGCGPGGGVRV